MGPEIQNPNVIPQRLRDSYQKAYDLLIDGGWGVSKDEYTDMTAYAGLTESHEWAIWLEDEAIEQMEKLWLIDELDLKSYAPHVVREAAHKILEEGGWKVYWDDTPLEQGYINWFIEIDGGDLGSGIRADWMSEDVVASPNRPLGILLSIGVIAWFVKGLRH